MPMPPERLDAMYWAGFCDDTLLHASGTDLKRGHADRVEWLQGHINDCVDCQRATKLKNLEFRIAERLNAVDRFKSGQDLFDLDGYDEAHEEILNKAMGIGFISKADLGWMKKMAVRHGNPWPGRIE